MVDPTFWRSNCSCNWQFATRVHVGLVLRVKVSLMVGSKVRVYVVFFSLFSGLFRVGFRSVSDWFGLMGKAGSGEAEKQKAKKQRSSKAEKQEPHKSKVAGKKGKAGKKGTIIHRKKKLSGKK